MSQDPLRQFQKTQDWFVGVDSDGCAFDTMEVKHKECFIPPFVRIFGLAPVARMARECCEFVNLYSRWRGENRFPAYVKALDFLAERPEVARRGFRVPRLDGLRSWIERETKLANNTLKAEVERTGDPDLQQALEWSLAVNEAVEATVKHVPPFPGVRESLERLSGRADIMVVSATPGAALEREWAEHGLARYVGLIAGQELGKKKEHLALAAVGKYPPDRILMIGDAPGDLNAARANGVLFYPIEPGREEASWSRFLEEAMPRFLEGRYGGDYMGELVNRFEAMLPSVPPWSRGASGVES
jgi:phosphoglycolate phosphatase-like HAD superfamily hydrolase